MKPLDVFFMVVILVLLGLFLWQIPDAISREMDFNEGIRQARCDKGWVDGYCDGLVRKDWLTQLAEAKHKQ